MEVMEVHSTPSMIRFLTSAKEEGWKVLGAALGDDSVPLDSLLARDNELKVLDSSIILVLGSEGRGLRTIIKNLCDALVVIQGTNIGGREQIMGGGDGEDQQQQSSNKGNVDSLNVSASGAVLLYMLKFLQGQKLSS
mmetsp:Transcript_18888/g.26589  ORF Transcript_18888/g.26589 Transcript_18888/m.26589 type:complete len:137 (-) Transcript_18888:238-648(-)